MSELTDQLGLSGPIAEAVRSAWKEWGQVLGLEGDSLMVFMDLMLERSNKMTGGSMPPGFELILEKGQAPRTIGGPLRAVWESESRDLVRGPDREAYINVIEEEYRHEDDFDLGLDGGGPVVRASPASNGAWISMWRWVYADEANVEHDD